MYKTVFSTADLALDTYSEGCPKTIAYISSDGSRIDKSNRDEVAAFCNRFMSERRLEKKSRNISAHRKAP